MNLDRIVPNTAIDLLTNYSVCLNASGKQLVKISAENAGIFNLPQELEGNLFCDEPVSVFKIGDDVDAFTIYFVAAYDYKGFFKGETEITSDSTVDRDGRTLYKAVLANEQLSIEKVGL